MTPPWQRATQRHKPLLGLWAHPKSFKAEPERMAELIAAAGYNQVRLAATYHAGRLLVTTSTPGQSLYLPGGESFFRRNSELYKGQVIQPLERDESNESLFARAQEALAARGVSTIAWVVALHNDDLATRYPEFALQSPLGTRYRHALCPAQEASADYVASLVRDVAEQLGVGLLDLEAAGYMGWEHASEHEKFGISIGATERYLLSLCVCAGCANRFTGAGVDVEEIKARAAAWFRARLHAQSAERHDTPADVLGADVITTVDTVRRDVCASLARRVREELPIKVSLRATANEGSFGGKTSGDLGALAQAAGQLTLSNLDNDASLLLSDVDQALDANVDAEQITASVSLWSQYLRSADELSALVEPLLARGIGNLCFYAFDLVAPFRLSWPARSVASSSFVGASRADVR